MGFDHGPAPIYLYRTATYETRSVYPTETSTLFLDKLLLFSYIINIQTIHVNYSKL